MKEETWEADLRAVVAALRSWEGIVPSDEEKGRVSRAIAARVAEGLPETGENLAFWFATVAAGVVLVSLTGLLAQAPWRETQFLWRLAAPVLFMGIAAPLTLAVDAARDELRE